MRLEQLDAVIHRVWRLQRLHHRLQPYPSWPPRPYSWKKKIIRRLRLRSAVGKELVFLSESFYFAWRLRQVLTELPDFKKFDPIGIRNVRFHLLDHPEKTSQALNFNFMFGHERQEGPVLKPMSPREVDVNDRGLYVNAREMLEELVPRLRRAVTLKRHR
jgi:hypothetical protein